MDKETECPERLQHLSRRAYTLGIAGGAIESTVKRGGRRRLRTQPIKSEKLIENAQGQMRERLREQVEPFEVHYTGGETAVLTWTKRNEKELMPVPTKAEAKGGQYRERTIEVVHKPYRLPK